MKKSEKKVNGHRVLKIKNKIEKGDKQTNK